MATWIVTDAAPGTGPRVAVKDLIDVAGLPTTAGCRAVADRALPAERDAACLAGLRAAMATGRARFAGKTNLHELAYGISAQAWQASKDLVAAADQLGADVRDRLKLASAITPAQVAAAEQVIARWRETLDALWHQVDLLAAPTLLGFPPLLEEAHILFKIRALTSPVNAAGLPALALPAAVPGRNTGPIPANMQLIGPRNGEDRLLAAGALIEQAVHG